MMNEKNSEIEPIQPAEAARILAPKLEQLEEEGWRILSRTDYTARLMQGKKNLDVYIDLLGDLQMQERLLTPIQESAHMIALVLFAVLFMIILVLVSALGLLD